MSAKGVKGTRTAAAAFASSTAREVSVEKGPFFVSAEPSGSRVAPMAPIDPTPPTTTPMAHLDIIDTITATSRPLIEAGVPSVRAVPVAAPRPYRKARHKGHPSAHTRAPPEIRPSRPKLTGTAIARNAAAPLLDWRRWNRRGRSVVVKARTAVTPTTSAPKTNAAKSKKARGFV